MLGIVVTTKNEIEIREFAAPLYKSLGEAVGGYIEIVHPTGLEDPFVMIVNEDGLRLELELNLLGSCMYATHVHGHPIVGDIVIMKTGWTPDGPDVIGLTTEEADALAEIFKQTIVKIERS